MRVLLQPSRPGDRVVALEITAELDNTRFISVSLVDDVSLDVIRDYYIEDPAHILVFFWMIEQAKIEHIGGKRA